MEETADILTFTTVETSDNLNTFRRKVNGLGIQAARNILNGLSVSSATITDDGWYTVAICEEDNIASGRLGIVCNSTDVNKTNADYHNLILYASYNFGVNSKSIDVIQNSCSYPDLEDIPFWKVRTKLMRRNSTYPSDAEISRKGCAIQVFIKARSDVSYSIYDLGDDTQETLWTLKSFLPDASDPGFGADWSLYVQRGVKYLNGLGERNVIRQGPVAFPPSSSVGMFNMVPESNLVTFLNDKREIIVGGHARWFYDQVADAQYETHNHLLRWLNLPLRTDATSKPLRIFQGTNTMHYIDEEGYLWGVGSGETVGQCEKLNNGSLASNSIHNWIRCGWYNPLNQPRFEKVVYGSYSENKDGDGFVAFLDEDGHILLSGRNDYGQLGNGTTVWTRNETSVTATSLKRNLLAYGDGSAARLKVPHVANPMLTAGGAVTDDPALAVSLLKVIDVVITAYVTTLLCEDGKVYTAGYGGGGELGSGGTANRSTFSPVLSAAATPLTNIVEIYVMSNSEYDSACVAKDVNGQVWAWGRDTNYWMGLGTTSNKTYATKIFNGPGQIGSGKTVKQIYTSADVYSGDRGSLLIVTDEFQPKAYFAGKANYGYYEYGEDSGLATTFTQIVNGPFSSDYKMIKLARANSHGYSSTIVLTENVNTGKYDLWAAGANYHGQLGVGNISDDTGADSTWTNTGVDSIINKWTKVPFNQDYIQDIHSIYFVNTRDHDWFGANEDVQRCIIILNDGRIFGSGRFPWINPQGTTVYDNGALKVFTELTKSVVS